jgi:hypothetical protein
MCLTPIGKFVRMIAKATGRPAFDRKVTEAY